MNFLIFTRISKSHEDQHFVDKNDAIVQRWLSEKKTIDISLFVFELVSPVKGWKMWKKCQDGRFSNQTKMMCNGNVYAYEPIDIFIDLSNSHHRLLS